MRVVARLTPLLLVILMPAARAQAPVGNTARADRAQEIRLEAAAFQRARPLPTHTNNGDEALYPSRFASFSKGLPHNAVGEPVLTQYDALLAAILSGNPADFEAIVLGGERKLANPLAGYAYVLEGADPHAIAMRPAPTFTSAEVAGEMEELYWMALVRDVRFDQYGSDSTVAQAVNRLNQLRVYRGVRNSSGVVTTGTVFRADLPGVTTGPFISQYLLKTVPVSGGPLAVGSDTNPPPAGVEPTGLQVSDQRILTRFPGDDRVTAFNEWLSIQDGHLPADPTDTLEDYDPVRRYIRNGRDLAEWVHYDYPLQAALQAALIIARQDDFLPDGTYDPDPASSPALLDSVSPYRTYTKQEPFITFGNSDAQSVTALVTNTSLRAQWFQKWLVHRRLRPEEYGGRVHRRRTGATTAYPVPEELLSSPVLPLVLARNAEINAARGLGAGTYLLAQAFPEGSPIHPSYGSGHSTYIGAGATAIKAFYGSPTNRYVINPQVPNADGTALVPYSGSLDPFDEVDKLVSNVGVARLFAGVHYRSDHDHAVRLGELYTLRTLQDWLRLYQESPRRFRVPTFGGALIELTATSPPLPNVVSAVDSFTLIDAATNQPVPGFDPLYNGAVIDLSTLAAQGITSFNVRANTYPSDVGSVRFGYDATASTNVDSVPPFALADDVSGDYPSFNFTVGTHAVRATPFSGDNATILGGVPLTIRFTVQQ
jgi:hypothetical protein